MKTFITGIILACVLALPLLAQSDGISFSSSSPPQTLANLQGAVTDRVLLGNTVPAWTAAAIADCAASGKAVNYSTSTHAFSCNASIDAATLLNATWASPAAIGTGTPAAGTFTALTSDAYNGRTLGSGTITFAGGTASSGSTTAAVTLKSPDNSGAGSAGAVSIDTGSSTSNAQRTVNIGNSNAAQINIGANGSTANSIQIGSNASFNLANTIAINANNGAVTLYSNPALARAGTRNAGTRIIDRISSVAAIDCAGAGINSTVTQLIDGGIFTCATAQTLTMPTAQGSSGIVQGLPGAPGIGDVFQFHMISTASFAFTLAAGTGITLFGNTKIANGSTTWFCRLSSVTNNSETMDCYGGGGNGPSFGNFSAYNSANLGGATQLSSTLFDYASTLTADSNLTYEITGVGAGNYVARLCSDGTTCGAGNIYLTCTKACTDAAGTKTACTVTKAAVPAATTLTWEIGTNCTTEPATNHLAHYTTP